MPLHSQNAAAATGTQPSTAVLKQAIGASITPKKLVAAGDRRGLTIFNHSISPLYIDFGASVSPNNFAVRIPSQGYYELPFGSSFEMAGVWEQAQGKAFIREFV